MLAPSPALVSLVRLSRVRLCRGAKEVRSTGQAELRVQHWRVQHWRDCLIIKAIIIFDKLNSLNNINNLNDDDNNIIVIIVIIGIIGIIVIIVIIAIFVIIAII